jgi:hypothetical protein
VAEVAIMKKGAANVTDSAGSKHEKGRDNGEQRSKVCFSVNYSI